MLTSDHEGRAGQSPNPAPSQSGKHAVVTGAASGIGLDCCRSLLESGWTVFGLDHSEVTLRGAADAFGAHDGRFFPLVCDVSNAGAVRDAFAEIEARAPALDALICSAGIFRTGPLLEMAEADFDALFAVNTKGAWLSAKAALPALLRAAREDAPARIVFVASVAAIRPKVGGAAYAASKAALAQMTRVLAVELAGRSILVNAVAPATVDTPMTQKLNADAATNGYKVSGLSPLGRVAVPSDVTAVIRFLLSDAANYLAGVVLPIDGGTSAAFQPK
jgi:NAD(P)-dependent dehydrogenase (short-subunit alcohol dehydrogenase family)